MNARCRCSSTWARGIIETAVAPKTVTPLAVLATAPWSRAREHPVQCGDPVVLRARRHHEGAVLAALDTPGGPAAAFVLHRDERLQFGFDGRVVPEGKAQA